MEKVAVMVSGGVDSFIAYRLALTEYDPSNVIPLFINYGQPYAHKEEQSVRLLIPNVTVINADLVADKLDNIPTLEKQEIFGRNLMVAFYGALVADRVWISALETEMNPLAVRDKHPEFFFMCSTILTYIMKGKRPKVTVETPFENDTKSDIIKMAIMSGIATRGEILNTVSCYHEEHQNCGMCSTCFKRWVAMTNNDLHEEYHANPYLDNAYGKKIINLMAQEVACHSYSGRFTKKRIAETDSALVLNGYKGIITMADEMRRAGKVQE